MASNANWIESHLIYLTALKSPNENQQRFVELALLDKRTSLQEKQFKAAMKLEKLAQQMLSAKAEAAKLKNAAKREERKARDHELYNSAGLMIVAGLVDTVSGKPVLDKAELLGALMGLSKVPADDPRRKDWKKAGSEKLNETSTKKPQTTS